MQDRSQELDTQGQQTPAGTGTSSAARTLADVWQASSSDAANQSRSAAGDRGLLQSDRGLLQSLQEVQASLTSRVSGNTPAADKDTQSGTGSPKSFLDSIRDNGPVMSNPKSSPASNSARTEEEQIRASRQRRMQEQGLDGRGSTGWRTGDGSEDGALSEAENFSELLRPESDTESASLSAEQFTLYALSPTPLPRFLNTCDC